MLDVFIAVIRFVPKVTYLGLEHQTLLLKANTQNMTSAAVSHALMLGRVGLGLELMEQSRAIFWQQLMRFRSKQLVFADAPAALSEELQQILHTLSDKVASPYEYNDFFTLPAWTRTGLTESRRLSE
jgi:hypothetical protein